jgi:hypothetical protein
MGETCSINGREVNVQELKDKFFEESRKFGIPKIRRSYYIKIFQKEMG